MIRSGFTSTIIKACLDKLGKRRKIKKQHSEKPLYFPIPFISDSFNYKMQRIFNNFNIPVHIYNHGNSSLRQFLSKRKKKLPECNKRKCPVGDNKMCFLYNIVYSIKCNVCQNEYIGSTTRYLHDRIQQHLFHSTNSAITEHLQTCGTSDNLIISVVSKHKNILDTRLAESIAIFRRKPTLNRKHECESSVAIIQHYTDTLNTHSHD
jgi:hypothetical protein